MKKNIQERKEAAKDKISAIKETAMQRKEFYTANFKVRLEEQKERFE